MAAASDQPPSDEETPYDVFVSYARADNATGWVSTLVGLMRRAHAGDGSPPLRVFFDTDQIHGMNLWRQRIEGALRRSRVLLVCLSPNFRDSPYCQWEWAAYHGARAARRARSTETTAVVRFVVVPGSDPGAPQAWINEVRESNYLLDLKAWFADGDGAPTSPGAWIEQDGEQQARQVFVRLMAHVRSERAAQRAQGNLRGGNPYFVGRVDALRALHRTLALRQAGVVCAVQGLGGIGKTELALQYGYEQAWNYSAGLWQLPAEGHRELLPLLSTLAGDSTFLEMHGQGGKPLQFTPQEQADSHALGRRVLQAMLARAQRLRDDERAALNGAGYTLEPQGGGAVLVILDNVDSAALLSQRELVQLPELNQARDRIRFLATSRIGKDELSAGSVQVVELGRLSRDEAMALMAGHRHGAAYPNSGYEAAVSEIVDLLDGYTLAVEQVAVYLGLNPAVDAKALLDTFRSQGLTLSDTLLSADPRLKGEILHPHALFDIVLGQTLHSLDSLPLARAALDFAAWLAPEHISWDWLEALVRQAHPAEFKAAGHLPQPWARARARLEAAQLLPRSPSGATWLHRLVGEHLRRRHGNEPEGVGAMLQAAVDQHAIAIAFHLQEEFFRSPQRLRSDLWALRAIAQHWQQSGRSDGVAALVAGIASGIELSFGSFARAGELVAFALRCHEALAANDDGDSKAKRDVSVSLEFLAAFLLRRGAAGDGDAAFTHMQRSLEIRDQLVANDPTDNWLQRHVSISLNQVADFLLRRGAAGDSDTALSHMQRSLKIREGLAAADPSNEKAQREISISLDDLAGFVLQRGVAGDADTAFNYLQRSLAICEKLAADHPADNQAQRDVSVSLNKLSSLLLHRAGAGDADTAFLHLQRSLAIGQTLGALDATDSVAQRDLAVVHQHLATATSAAGDTHAELMHLRTAFALHQALFDATPIAVNADSLATSAWRFSKALADSQDAAMQQEAAEKAALTGRLLSALEAAGSLPQRLRQLHEYLKTQTNGSHDPHP